MTEIDAVAALGDVANDFFDAVDRARGVLNACDLPYRARRKLQSAINNGSRAGFAALDAEGIVVRAAVHRAQVSKADAGEDPK